MTSERGLLSIASIFSKRGSKPSPVDMFPGGLGPPRAAARLPRRRGRPRVAAASHTALPGRGRLGGGGRPAGSLPGGRPAAPRRVHAPASRPGPRPLPRLLPRERLQRSAGGILHRCRSLNAPPPWPGPVRLGQAPRAVRPRPPPRGRGQGGAGAAATASPGDAGKGGSDANMSAFLFEQIRGRCAARMRGRTTGEGGATDARVPVWSAARMRNRLTEKGVEKRTRACAAG